MSKTNLSSRTATSNESSGCDDGDDDDGDEEDDRNADDGDNRADIAGYYEKFMFLNYITAYSVS